MDLSNVQSPHGVTLVGAGPFKRSDLVESVALAPTLIAADGGANLCVSAGFFPEAVIGDLDSILPGTRAALPDANFIEIAEQDTTDFEKCMQRIDAPFVLATGFAAGRLDHMLAVLSVMARDVGPPVILLADRDILFAAPKEITLDVKAGTRVSLFPLAEVKGASNGLKWPIDRLQLHPMVMVGTSNEATGPVRLTFETPGCLVIMPREALGPVLVGLID